MEKQFNLFDIEDGTWGIIWDKTKEVGWEHFNFWLINWIFYSFIYLKKIFSTCYMPDTILDVENSIKNVSSGEDSYENKYGKHYNRSMCKMP